MLSPLFARCAHRPRRALLRQQLTPFALFSSSRAGSRFLARSNGLFDGVAESSTDPQGVVMPPKVPEGFGEFWFAEGDLINKLVDKYGEAVAI